MAIELKVPAVGESISEVEIGNWLKTEGQAVKEGETIVVIETEKATVDLPSPATGVLGKILKPTGQVATVGEVIASIEAGAAAPAAAAAEVAQPPPSGLVQQAPLKFTTMQEAEDDLKQQIKLFADKFSSGEIVTSQHPVFGDLNFEEWVLLHYKHILHHARQFGLI